MLQRLQQENSTSCTIFNDQRPFCHRRLNSHNKSIDYTRGKIMRLTIPQNHFRTLLSKSLHKRWFRRQKQHIFINLKFRRNLHLCFVEDRPFPWLILAIIPSWTKGRLFSLKKRTWIHYLASLVSLRKGIMWIQRGRIAVFVLKQPCLRSLNVPFDPRHIFFTALLTVNTACLIWNNSGSVLLVSRV